MKFVVMDRTGESVLEYDMTVEKEAELAAKQFNTFLSQGNQIIGIMPTEEKFMSSQFEPEVVTYVIGKPLVGG